ncbi:MAG: GNAT family N-acetyltransferase [Rhodospirillales bacterium]|nr:GNAT family N-acetyltransferase [Rhodospirillales bacterium]
MFRAWPYLYDGSEAAEARHLEHFAASAHAALVVARQGGEIVGCSTCQPLEEQSDNLLEPFRAAGIEPHRVFYFGESVLLPAYRGQGAGVAFFTAREAHARAVSRCDLAAFCSVIRPEQHRLRPPGDVPLDGFWSRRGYARRPDLVCNMRWKQIDGDEEVENRLVFWTKSLR